MALSYRKYSLFFVAATQIAATPGRLPFASRSSTEIGGSDWELQVTDRPLLFPFVIQPDTAGPERTLGLALGMITYEEEIRT